MEPSSSVPESSDRHVLLLTEGNFEITLNLDKILVHVLRYCVISLYVLTRLITVETDSLFFSNVKRLILTIFINVFSKEPTKHQDLSIAPLRRSMLNFDDLDCHVQFFRWYWIIT